jgi:hypothetical protein
MDSSPENNNQGGKFLNALIQGIRMAADFKRGYDNPDFYRGNRTRLASDRFQDMILDSQRRNDERADAARAARMEADEKSRNSRLLTNLYNRGDISKEQYLQGITSGVMPSFDAPESVLNPETFDYSKYGLEGFGMEDIKGVLQDYPGTTFDQLQELGENARNRGLNIGSKASDVIGF